MFNTNRKTVAALLALVVLVSAGTVGVMGAAPTVDTETTDTATTSEITDGGAQTYNDSTTSYLNWSADSQNSKVVISQDGTTLFEATPEFETNASGTYYFNVSLADNASDYSAIDVGAGENATLNVTLINNTQATNPDKTNVSFTFANGESEEFSRVDSAKTEEEDSGFFSSLSGVFSSSSDDTKAAQTEEETTITENTSTVTMSVTDSNLSSALGASVSEKDAGDIVWAAHLKNSEGGFVPILASSSEDAPEWIDTDSQAYAVVSDDGETVTVHNADELIDSDSQAVTLTLTGNEKLGLTNAQSMMRSYGAGWGTIGTNAFAAWDKDLDPTYVEG